MCLFRERHNHNDDEEDMGHLLTNLEELYQTYFQKPYFVQPKTEVRNVGMFGTALSENIKGVEVFLPVTLKNSQYSIRIACATVRINGSKTVVRTPVSERVGTVKEVFNVGDYKIEVKGGLIAEREMAMPDNEMSTLRWLYESTEPIVMENALTDLFLDQSKYVCITDLEFPEVEGKTLRHRPFRMSLESDYIKSLLIEN